MKMLGITAAVAGLVGLIVWLIVGQTRVQRQLEAVLEMQRQNALTRESSSAETGVADRETRVDPASSQSQLAATQQRINNLVAKIDELNSKLDKISASFDRRASVSASPPPQPETPNAFPTRRAWGPEQVTGPPDTHRAGDISTAWASREPDGGHEWLTLDYERAVEVAQIKVRETFNPGAISKVAVILPNGQETPIWEGVEPAATAPIETAFEVPVGMRSKSIRIYLDTSRVPGWNEIDAVELIGRDGSRQWAAQASASSTYAEGRGALGSTLSTNP